jgi:hypothetical protein
MNILLTFTNYIWINLLKNMFLCFLHQSVSLSISIDRQKVLGKGAYGIVYEGTWKGRKVAVKRISNRKRWKQQRRRRSSAILRSPKCRQTLSRWKRHWFQVYKIYERKKKRKTLIYCSNQSEFMRWNFARHHWIKNSWMTRNRENTVDPCRQKRKFSSSWPRDWHTFIKTDWSIETLNLKTSSSGWIQLEKKS